MNIYCKIQDLKRQGLKKLQVARHMRMDVKTVRKYWDMTQKDYSEYVLDCSRRTTSMKAYEGFIMDKLQKYPDVSAAQIYDWLREQDKNFKPSSSTVRMHVKVVRDREGLVKHTKLRQYEAVEDMPFGFQAQVDMGVQNMTNAYGKIKKVYAFCMSMSASRQKFTYFEDKPFTSETFVKAHQLAFEYYGGRTEEIVYDQDRVLCVSENKGNVLFTEKFDIFKCYHGFNVRLCRGSDPQSKGKIEAVVKYVKNNFLRYRIYHGIQTLNSQGLDWLDRTGNGTQHNTTKLIPKDVFVHEQKHLIPVYAIEMETKPLLYHVRKDNVISYKSNRYALPTGTYMPGKKVAVKEEGANLFVCDENGKELVCHSLCSERGKLIRLRRPDRSPYIKHKALFNEVLELFGGSDKAKFYLNESQEKFPRYLLDIFKEFKKVINESTASELSFALDYCELFHSTEFKDTIAYFRTLESQKFIPDEFAIPPKYALIAAEERDIATYSQIYGGNL